MTARLGISAFYHDNTAALAVDGDIVLRRGKSNFTRKKHDFGFSELAIRYCTEEQGLRVEALDYVAFHDKFLTKSNDG